MGYMQRSAGKVKIAGSSIDRRSNSRGTEAQEKPNDILKRKYKAFDETESQSSQQEEVKKRKPNLDALDKLIEDTVERNYGFGKHLQVLEKELSGYEEKIRKITKEQETLLLDQKQLGETINLLRNSPNSKLLEISQRLNIDKSKISTDIGNNAEQLQDLRKLREEKLSHIQNINTERDKYRNQYKALLDLCKSNLAIESPKKSTDKQLSEQNHEASQIKAQLSDQKALDISKTTFDEMAEKTQYAVEQTYKFNNRIHTLEQEKLREKEEHEQKMLNLKELEQKKLAEENEFSSFLKILSDAKSSRLREALQPLNVYKDVLMQEKLAYKKEQDDLIHKFEASQKKKEDRIQELNKERNDCLKRYTDHIFGLYKSSFAIDNADKLANDQFKRDMLIASTTALSNMNFRSNNGLGELIKNILKSVLEGKL